jgi:hypothetical protein
MYARALIKFSFQQNLTKALAIYYNDGETIGKYAKQKQKIELMRSACSLYEHYANSGTISATPQSPEIYLQARKASLLPRVFFFGRNFRNFDGNRNFHTPEN